MPVLAILTLLVLGACTSVVTPKLDEQTGTSLAQRCVDYRAVIATYEQLGELDHPAYIAAKGFVVANCPVLQPAPAAPSGDAPVA